MSHQLSWVTFYTQSIMMVISRQHSWEVRNVQNCICELSRVVFGQRICEFPSTLTLETEVLEYDPSLYFTYHHASELEAQLSEWWILALFTLPFLGCGFWVIGHSTHLQVKDVGFRKSVNYVVHHQKCHCQKKSVKYQDQYYHLHETSHSQHKVRTMLLLCANHQLWPR